MKVFIYGTLKRGFPLFEKGLVGARYLDDVETVEPYPLYIAASFYGPMMLNRRGAACSRRVVRNGGGSSTRSRRA
ncbi:gamma-glutamylcyclotransferase [Rhizobium sp. BK650]|uniref:gamma-glutamylcyclotransferase n=1 Tax=Rhizobium sp. BK650 TaxID=2586990 RepID=UPI0016089FDD